MTEHKELKQKMYEWTEKYANKAGYRLNPDKDAIDYLLDGKVVLMVSSKEQTEKYSKHIKKYKN